MRNVPERKCTNFLTSIIKKKTEGTPIMDIVAEKKEKTEILVDAERSKKFTFDKESQVLKTKKFRGPKEPLAISAKKGLVGKAFNDKIVKKIPDAYSCEFFDSKKDMASDYHTTSLLKKPVLNNRSEPVGVKKFLNKRDGKPFSKKKIEFVNIFMTFCGKKMENDVMYCESSKKKLQVTSFVNVSMRKKSNSAVKSILGDIKKNARKVINAERASKKLLDNVVNCLST
ncbi:hypothetical protein TRFO_33842 [Tritrichomonas foetus]|uniref:Uncharacterized protein n=1 Tax=Tritrichomonas foetus TaxID=1144522 RepID=A0A1J4JMQ1_9EUKA|nr:hypothetical protein TRFO_33842 [Tritrichomonas foetus]|eukprot:OHS99711.1 hypothetical protein TRFO_33842 [Tritrichomonas foetus]